MAPSNARQDLLAMVQSLQDLLPPSDHSVLGHWAPHAGPAAKAVSPPPSARPEDKLRQLLEKQIGDCHRCPLGDTRQKIAFGVGNPRARVMLVGEGPGYMEDRQGEPFVGPAGQLLDKILAAIELSRQPVEPSWRWVYIANIVKCHPMKEPEQPDKRGNDRPPTPEEMDACFPFLAEQIRIVRPWIILSLGATAAKSLLKTSRGITALRGQWFDFHLDGCDPMRLMPTFHPAALLRDPALKRDVWEDVKKLSGDLKRRLSSDV
ncbi:MAG TPA: uracil-DNA glycosylase [Elusimicrobiota bacterium]|nr:uracil-DNA glycosylase [Elusimicrobiota bacterium]